MCLKINGSTKTVANYHVNNLIITLFLQDFNQMRIQNPVEYLRWSFLQRLPAAKFYELFSQKAPSQMFDWVLNTHLYIMVQIKTIVSIRKPLSIFAKSFILDVWQGFEYISKVSRFVLRFSLWTLICTSKCQMEIKIPLWQISIETNHADVRKLV